MTDENNNNDNNNRKISSSSNNPNQIFPLRNCLLLMSFTLIDIF